MKKNFLQFYSFISFHFLSLEFIIFNIDYSNNYIDLNATKKDRRNHLLIKHLSGKWQESLTCFTLNFNLYIFLYITD